MQEESIYTQALYRFNGGKLEVVSKQCLIPYEELVDMLNEKNENVVFVGDGIDVAGAYIKDNLKCEYSFAPAHIKTQRASSVALAAMDMAKAGKTISSDEMKPDYLRPSQAEREHNKAQ